MPKSRCKCGTEVYFDGAIYVNFQKDIKLLRYAICPICDCMYQLEIKEYIPKEKNATKK
jgi:hypothetical protein